MVTPVAAVILLGLFLCESLLIPTVRAAPSPWTQTDWSGGSGQTSWSDTNRYSTGSSVNTAVANQVTLAEPSDWFDTDWSYRKQITFNNAAQAENLIDFPVLVTLTSSNFDFSRAQASGQDIRFTDSDGTTALSYEIEKWDSGSSQAIIWVKVPQINASSAVDSIYMYYGNGSAVDGQSAATTWNSGYVSVWHLRETGAGTALEYVDSKTAANSGQGGGGTASQVPTLNSTGKIDGAQTFGTDDYILIPNESNYDFNNTTFTVSGWFKTSNTNAQHIISKNDAANHGGWSVDMSANKLRGTIKNANGPGTVSAQRPTVNNYVDGVWRQFTVVFTTDTVTAGNNTVSVYINGAPENGTLIQGGLVYTTADFPVNLGRRSNAATYFTGDLDQVEIANVGRSAAWIAANYLSQNNTFNTFSSEQQQTGPTGTLTSSIFNTEQHSNWGTLTYAATIPANTAVAVKVRTSSSATMTGAPSFSSCTAISSGADISSNNCVSDGHQYVQYQLTLSNTDGASTPTFTSFSLSFTQTPPAATYYFDSVGGSDSNTGTSESQAWKTVAKFNSTTFSAGDTILFKRGGIWDGGLQISESGTAGQPITLSDYGTGIRPRFRDTANDDEERALEVTGDYIIIQNAMFDDSGKSGVEIYQGATNNIVRYCDFHNVGLGVTIKGDDNTITDNTFEDLIMVRNTIGGEDDYGAIAVNINATEDDDEIVSGTLITNNLAYRAVAESHDYDFDGGFVETFGGIDDLTISHNFVQDSKGFIEIGSDIGDLALAQNIFIYNNISLNNYGIFLFTNGGLYAADIENVVVQNNTIYEAEEETSLFFFDNGTPLANDFTLQNNVMYGRSAFVNCNGGSCTPNGAFVHENNIYSRVTGTQVGFNINASELQINFSEPNLVSTTLGAEDLRLRTDSPAINFGLALGYEDDYYHTLRPQGVAADAGAYEVSVASAPATLAQYHNDGSSVIPTGGWTNATDPILRFGAGSYNYSDTLTPKVEVKSTSTTFDGTGLVTGSTVVASSDTTTASVQLSSMTEGEYHWRAISSNVIGSSSYVSYGANAESVADFGVDLTDPTANTFTINDGDATTTDDEVDLTLSATDSLSGVAEMIISEQADFSGASWVAYNTNSTFTLSSGGGLKTLYAKFRDEAGNESAPLSDSIEYDPPDPTPTPTPSATPTPTPSSTSNTSSGGGGTSQPTTPGCSDTAPSGAPYLYEIRRYGEQAELYFTPTQPVSEYFVAYGRGTDVYEYGYHVDAAPTDGAVKVTVGDLDSQRSYTFKVRAGNGCRPGEWSNELTTEAGGTRGRVQFFANKSTAPLVKTLTSEQKKVTADFKVEIDERVTIPANSDIQLSSSKEQPATTSSSQPSTDPSQTDTSKEEKDKGFFAGLWEWIKKLFGWQ